MSDHLLTVTITVPEDLPADESARLTAMIERLGFTALHGPCPPAAGVVRVNDPVLVAEARAAATADDDGVAVAVPISVGRTWSEARARADLDLRFSADRDPERVGLFGAFEDVQEQVLELARAGADGLVLDIPLERDIADVLAQIRALVVGAAPLLREMAPAARSEVPETVFYAEDWTAPEGYFDL
jgi:hypothetical protein